MKGSVIQVDNIFYVVVEEVGNSLHCLCDNANNRYFWDKKDVLITLTPKQAMEYYVYGQVFDECELSDKLHEFGREIPADVIAQVLSGLQDERFSDYKDAK